MELLAKIFLAPILAERRAKPFPYSKELEEDFRNYNAKFEAAEAAFLSLQREYSLLEQP
jgi:hypothetical protein